MLSCVALVGVLATGAALAQSNGSSSTPQTTAAAQPPLPQGPSTSPAQPNCYPDINHCASYPTGDSVKDNSYQYVSPQQQPKPAPQPQK
jgi:hypothetical protein